MAVSANAQYPLGIPTVSGALVTVDSALQKPTIINRALSDLTLRGYFADRIFPNGGGITGGAVEYFQLLSNDLFPLRDVQNVEPGTELPIVTVDRPTPLVAQVETYGGKFYVTDEARRRNDPSLLSQGIQKVSNAIVRATHTKAIALLDASIAAVGSAATFAGHNWSTVVTAGTSATSNAGYPFADFAKAQLLADQTELGVDFNLWIMNPQELMNLRIAYGSDYTSILSQAGVEIVTSNRVTAGTAYCLAEGQVGQTLIEKPLTTESWREPETRRSWVASDVALTMVVTNPMSVLKVTGLAG